MNDSFYQIAIEKASKQRQMIDQFTEDSPILSAMPIEPSTHGLQNVYEELVSVDSAEQVDFDASLPEVGMDTKLVQENLAKFGAKMSVGEDTAQVYGGVAKYFNKKTPMFLRTTGQNMEKSILYNVIRAKAYAQGKWIDAGGSNNHNYSMLIVRWISGENIGLYDRAGFGTGKVFDLKAISGGNLHDIEKNGVKMLGYAQRFATYFGVQIGNKRYLSAILNIDLDDDGSGGFKNLPTSDQIDDALDDADAGSSTLIYCHPKVKRALGKYKSAKLNMIPTDKNYNTMLDYWDDIPIITSRNFKRGDEPDVT